MSEPVSFLWFLMFMNLVLHFRNLYQYILLANLINIAIVDMSCHYFICLGYRHLIFIGGRGGQGMNIQIIFQAQT